MNDDQVFALAVVFGDNLRTALLQRDTIEVPAEKPWQKPTTKSASKWIELPAARSASPDEIFTEHPELTFMCVVEEGGLRTVDGDDIDLDWGCIAAWCPGPDGPVRLRIPPFDVADSGHFDRLPEIPGATAMVQFTLEDGPFGDLDYLMRIVDGRIEAVESAWSADAQVFITSQWTTYLELRLARADPMEAAGRSAIKGEMARLSVVAGIMESEPFVTARRENAAMMTALIDFGAAAPAELTMDRIRQWRKTQ